MYWSPPPPPVSKREAKTVVVKGASRDGPVEVPDNLSLYVSTWNMSGCTSQLSHNDMLHWLPLDYDLYAIALQQCRSIKQIQERILEVLGGPNLFQAFKNLTVGQSSLLLFARLSLMKAGVLSSTRLNDSAKFETKTKGLMTSLTGKGCILMQIVFHNTTMAFVAVNLDDEIYGLERRAADLEFCLRASGIVQSETNEIGTPVLNSVQHVFLFGNFGIKTTEKCQGASKNTWKGKWADLRYSEEFEYITKLNPSLDNFEELDVTYPPTSRRKYFASRGSDLGSASLKRDITSKGPSSAPTKPSDLEDNRYLPNRKLSTSFVTLFEKDFDIELLFDAKLIKKEGEPSYEDRIFYRTHDKYLHLLETGVSGSCEGLRLGSHVPIFNTFRLCGLDNALLRRWQVITGNLPVENATRTDFRMITGVVEDLMSQLALKSQAEEAEAAYREKIRQEFLSKQRRCDRCFEPLSLEGGDVELGDKAAFHRGCFTCEDCGKDLFGDKLVFVDGRWLCSESFNRLYQSACPVCNIEITDERIRIGKDLVSYHPGCFNCADCGKTLFAEGSILPFDECNSKPYCLEDFSSKYEASTCSACKMTVLEDERVSLDIKFHKRCYCCCICGIDMTQSPLAIVIRGYKVYCEKDHLQDLKKEEKRQQILQEREEEKRIEMEEREEEARKEQELLDRRKSKIPAGFDLSNYDVPEDDDLADEDDE